MQQQKPSTVVIALWAYNSTGDGDITFKQGDSMTLLINDNPDWALVQHTSTKEKGFAPKNFFVAKESLESEEWFFSSISRKDAENLLSQNGLKPGMFLVRESSRGDLALSVVYNTPGSTEIEVLHYQIRKANDHRYFIPKNNKSASNKNMYRSVHDLIRRYSRKGLRCQLTKSCPKSQPRIWDISPRTQENYEIPKSDLTKVKCLGEGNFGVVWHAKYKGQMDVALKLLKIDSSMTRDSFLSEAKIMKQCRHKNLVSLFGVCTNDEPMFILTEYMSGGNLFDCMRKGEGKTFAINILIDMCGQIAQGMSYLAANHIVHRDLAARNVLVGDKEGEIPLVRVADFGLAKMFNDDYSVYVSKPGAGDLPVRWMSTEALFKNRFSVKSDIWSYGILLYEIFTRGGLPYRGMTNKEVGDSLKVGYRMPRPENCQEPLYEIMKMCWAEDPEKRVTFEYLINFFNGYNASTEGNSLHTFY